MIEFPFCRSLEGSSALQLIRRISHLLDFENGPWVAGGAIRRIVTRAESDDFDIDVFFKDNDQLQRLTPELRRIENDFYEGMEANTPEMKAGLRFNRSMHCPPLQLIAKLHFPTYGELIADFDFTICQMVTDGRTVRCPHRVINDLHERRLRLATGSVKNVSRVLRYFTYGFEPDAAVMQIAETCPMGSYYDPHGGGYRPFDPIIAKMALLDMENQITLSKVGDLLIERDGGIGIAYIGGHPFPAPMAFVYITAKDMRTEIEMKLMPLWEQKGLGGFKAPLPTQTNFLQSYRRAFADAGET